MHYLFQILRCISFLERESDTVYDLYLKKKSSKIPILVSLHVVSHFIFFCNCNQNVKFSSPYTA